MRSSGIFPIPPRQCFLPFSNIGSKAWLEGQIRIIESLRNIKSSPTINIEEAQLLACPVQLLTCTGNIFAIMGGGNSFLAHCFIKKKKKNTFFVIFLACCKPAAAQGRIKCCLMWILFFNLCCWSLFKEKKMLIYPCAV